MNPYPILYIEYGVAYIPMWQWDSSRDDIFGYPVAATVTDARPVPNNGYARRLQEGQASALPTISLNFPNGWTAVVAFNTDHPLYSAPAPGVYMTQSAIATILPPPIEDSQHDGSPEQSSVNSLDDLLRTIRAVADRATASI